MSKILIISRSVNETSLQLAKSLKNQQHEVYFLTSRDEAIHDTFGIHFLTYLKKWSPLEAFKFLPILLGIQPDIIHFLLTDFETSSAEVIMSTLAKVFPRCVITTSFLEIKESLKRKTSLKLMIKESDIVTVPSIEYMGHLRGIHTRSLRQSRGVLPPLLTFNPKPNHYAESNYLDSPLNLTLQNKKYMVIPFTHFFKNESSALKNLKLFSKKNFFIVFYGSWQGYSLAEKKSLEKKIGALGIHQWLVTGPINNSEFICLLKKSEILYLSGLKITSSELAELLVHTIAANATVVMDTQQSSIYSHVWKNKENCWILDLNYSPEAINELFEKEKLRLECNFNDSTTNNFTSNFLDLPINDLNRLYNKALLQKTKLRTQL